MQSYDQISQNTFYPITKLVFLTEHWTENPIEATPVICKYP